jgi:hypothetical protein
MGASDSKSVISQESEEKKPKTIKIWMLETPLEMFYPLLAGITLGTLLTYFFLINQPFILNPLIGNAVRATMAAQTPGLQMVFVPASTHTPYPTFTPNPTSTLYPTYTSQAALPTYTQVPAAALPSAQIVKPQFSDGPSPVQTDVSVAYQNIPIGKYLWVAVRVPKVEPNWLVYPQLLGGIPEPVIENGTLTTKIQLGKEGNTDAGQPFNILVLLLDESAHQAFLRYSSECISDPANPLSCGGLNLPESGVQILDFNTVIRR